jgi:HAD superfamily hydrolase (TIGR01509 family)
MIKKLLSTGLLCTLILFLCASITPPKTQAVLFDLNGVLFRLGKMKSARHLGLGTTISYIFQGGKTEHLEEKFFKILHQLDPEHYPNEDLMPLHKEAVLPKIMRDWLTGTVNSYDAIIRVHNRIDYLASDTEFFANKTEVELLKKIATLVFDPEIRAEIYKPIKKGIELVRACKKRGHEVYLISNMDTQLIELLKKLHPEIFDLFDGIVISADIKTIKPYRDIYMYTLLAYNLNPDHCHLIDDQNENLDGAKAVGMHGFLCNYRKYGDLIKEMIKEGLIEKSDIRKKDSAQIEQCSPDA